MTPKPRRLGRPEALSVQPHVYRGEWLQSAISRWAWSIFGVSRGALLDSFGLSELPENEIRQLGNSPNDDVLNNIALSIHLPVKTLYAMTMEGASHYRVDVPRSDAPTIATRYLWARNRGTRYCPDCLRERPGVFPAEWRLTWTFVCLRHERILLDACPECLLPIHEMTGRTRYVWNPNQCRANIGGGLPITPCYADLARPWQEPALPQNSFVLLTQAKIRQVISRGSHSDEFFHMLRGNAAALRASGETELIARFSGLPADELVGLIEPEQRVGSTPPSNAYGTAALVTAALMLAVTKDEVAGPLIRRVTFSRPPSPVPRGMGFGPGSPRELLTRWGAPYGDMREKILAAHDEDFTISQRLVYGTAIKAARLSTGTTGQQADIPRLDPLRVPPLLWTEWATPIDTGGPATEWALRSALTAALLTVGQGEQRPPYLDKNKTSDTQSEEHVRRLTRLLRPKMIGGPRDADRLVRSLTELALLLESEPPPIDYERRLSLPWRRLLTKEQWIDICAAVGHNPGGDVRLRNARRYLFKRATQAAPSALPPELAIGRHKQDAAEYSSFRAAVTRELQEGLDTYFLAVLHALDVDEPVVWAPDRRSVEQIVGGREIEDIDWALLHELRAEGCAESRLAHRLDRSVRHCLWAGDLHPHATAKAVDQINWTSTVISA